MTSCFSARSERRPPPPPRAPPPPPPPRKPPPPADTDPRDVPALAKLALPRADWALAALGDCILKALSRPPLFAAPEPRPRSPERACLLPPRSLVRACLFSP